jgi:chromosome partitioning protein
LFNNPSVEAMHALSPREFERFVAYVLRRAGYDVKEVAPHFLRGVDLEVRLPGRARIFAGVECKRFAPDQLVTAPIVRGVRGAPAVDRVGAKPFVITTSDFNEAAHRMAEEGARRVYLVNGPQLVRYITYIRGSRYDGDDVVTSLSPEYFAGRDPALQPDPNSTCTLTIATNKGGVGKTTTVYYLGVELARQGKRVLLIDLDGQGNLTERCLPAKVADRGEDEHFPNIAQYFAGECSLMDLIVPTETAPGVSIIPSDPFLTLRDLGGSGRPSVELGFAHDVQKLCAKQVASLGGMPDWIIMDTPPAISVFTRAAIAASNYVLAPIRPRSVSLAGTRNMVRALRTVNALTNKRTTFLGIVLTHWDDLAVNNRFKDLDLPRALQEFGGQEFEAKIPIDNRLDTLEPGARTGGARAYEALAAEVMHAIQSNVPATVRT